MTKDVFRYKLCWRFLTLLSLSLGQRPVLCRWCRIQSLGYHSIIFWIFLYCIYRQVKKFSRAIFTILMLSILLIWSFHSPLSLLKQLKFKVWQLCCQSTIFSIWHGSSHDSLRSWSSRVSPEIRRNTLIYVVFIGHKVFEVSGHVSTV